MSVDAEHSEGEYIKQPGEINRILSHVRDKLSPVTIRFPGVKRALTSYVMDIDPNRRYILLDEILPKIDNRIMQEGRKFSLETYYDGCRVRAKELAAKAVKGADGSTSYRVSFPSEIHYAQRRASYRAQVRRSLEIVARTLDIDRNVVSGMLRDMSAEGCQVQVSGDYVESLKAHTSAVPMKLYFPNGTSLVLKVELKFVGYDKDGGFTKCGCQFVQLDPHKEREISRVVTDLQRDYINFTKNGGRVEGIPPLFMPPEDGDDIDRLDGVQRPPGMSHTEKDERKARETRTQKRKENEPKIDVRQAHSAAIAAVKSLIGRVRLEQNLPLDELHQAATGLYTAWSQNREQLVLLTHVRSPSDFLFEHPVSMAVMLADQSSKNDPRLQADELKDLMFAGLCHDLPKAMLEGGDRLSGLKITPEQKRELSRQVKDLGALLNSQNRVPRVAVTVLTQNYERLDGSGLPDQLQADQLNPVGKLAAALDVLDTAGHVYRDDVYYFPAIAFKRALSMTEEIDAQLIKRTIMAQGLYPLGAPVRLSNNHLGLVMRHNEERKPRIVRIVYNLGQNSHLPPRDVNVIEEAITIEGHADPVKYALSGTLLKMPLQIS